VTEIRRRLGAALRAHRNRAQLTQKQLAELVGIPQPHVSRVETGQALPNPEQVDAWAAATDATADDRAALDALAEAAATEAVAWRRHGRRLAELQADIADLEATARVVRAYHPLLVHGLLQVPGYAAAVYEARARIEGQDRGEVAEAVAARVAKQAVLYREGHQFSFLVTEAGLRWQVAPRDVTLAQLDRLDMASRLPNVWLGVLPMAEAALWRWSGFTLYAERDDGGEDLVHLETLTTGLTVRNPVDVARHLRAFDDLDAAAVHGPLARELLARIAADLRG
jgi:transcriptional regulator with XRE-family HTH domain